MIIPEAEDTLATSRNGEQKRGRGPDIVAVGQTGIDRIFIDDNPPEIQVGGSAYIPAHLWASWGLSVGLVSCIGSGLSLSQIAAENLDLAGVKVWQEPASCVELHYSNQNLIGLRVQSGPSEKLAVSQIPSWFFNSRLFYISPAPLGFLVDLTEVVRTRGISLAFSPKEDFPPISEVRMRLVVSRCDICFLNEKELHLLTGCDSMQEAVSLLHSCGPRIVVVTRGKRGASVSSSAGEFFTLAPAHVLSIDNPVGAGDCFAAALVASLLADHSLRDSAEHANEMTVQWLIQREHTRKTTGNYA